jgi:hypothetical protein
VRSLRDEIQTHHVLTLATSGDQYDLWVRLGLQEPVSEVVPHHTGEMSKQLNSGDLAKTSRGDLICAPIATTESTFDVTLKVD